MCILWFSPHSCPKHQKNKMNIFSSWSRTERRVLYLLFLPIDCIPDFWINIFFSIQNYEPVHFNFLTLIIRSWDEQIWLKKVVYDLAAAWVGITSFLSGSLRRWSVFSCPSLHSVKFEPVFSSQLSTSLASGLESMHMAMLLLWSYRFHKPSVTGW